ncbi:hypothetical protein KKD49_19310 [Myxococcota bacterium]|nr:hypothetical protein [Myxococcota bacterium]
MNGSLKNTELRETDCNPPTSKGTPEKEPQRGSHIFTVFLWFFHRPFFIIDSWTYAIGVVTWGFHKKSRKIGLKEFFFLSTAFSAGFASPVAGSISRLND